MILGAFALGLSGCGGSSGGGGGGGGGGVVTPPVGTSTDWIEGTFLAASIYAAQCLAPRSGIDPSTNQAFPDVQGDAVDENNFLRSYSDDTYLWYSEITDRDPSLHATPDYFDLLVTNATTPSGQPKDKFHFTFPSDVWFQLSQSGISAGYGARWVLIESTPPREVVVAYTEPDSPARDAALARGAEVLIADGVDVVNATSQAQIDVLNDALFPEQAGGTHTFTVRDIDGTEREITMTAEEVTSTPVQNVSSISTPTGNVGYLLFNSHIATAETGLVDAVEQLQGMAITDLIVDLRYNGGGFLDLASEFAYMIAGAGPTTSGEIFEDLVFNDKYPTINPVTGQALSPTPFHSTTLGFSEPAGEPLPTLDLPRVFVLSGPNTCSASESVMNSLRGVGVEVIQIGSTTCGKPYGFYPTGNCGTTYFTIQFRGENNQGFGDYSDGFSPAGAGGMVDDETLPGCSVADDFTHALGDVDEGRLAAALAYRDSQDCPDPPTGLTAPGAILTSAGSDLSAVDGNAPASLWLQNRIMDRP